MPALNDAATLGIPRYGELCLRKGAEPFTYKASLTICRYFNYPPIEGNSKSGRFSRKFAPDFVVKLSIDNSTKRGHEHHSLISCPWRRRAHNGRLRELCHGSRSGAFVSDEQYRDADGRQSIAREHLFDYPQWVERCHARRGFEQSTNDARSWCAVFAGFQVLEHQLGLASITPRLGNARAMRDDGADVCWIAFWPYLGCPEDSARRRKTTETGRQIRHFTRSHKVAHRSLTS